jgi:FkbM family methyltransferase
MALGPANLKSIITLLSKSKSQLKQDLFILSETKYKREGYFVEFGATNGIDLSNTYLLETEFSWKGILAEPANAWKLKLHENRPNAFIETLCVWKDSNSLLTFNETDYPELSTIDIFSGNDDWYVNSRQEGKKYKVQTISLNDLLRKYQAPKYIDYLSIDTEGSEYEILKSFNFSEYSIGIITVEHNYTPQREMIFELLTSQGYKKKYENISNFDDWYVKI